MKKEFIYFIKKKKMTKFAELTFLEASLRDRAIVVLVRSRQMVKIVMRMKMT